MTYTRGETHRVGTSKNSTQMGVFRPKTTEAHFWCCDVVVGFRHGLVGRVRRRENEAGPWKTSSPGNKSTVTGVFGNIALDGVGENGVGELVIVVSLGVSGVSRWLSQEVVSFLSRSRGQVGDEFGGCESAKK